MNLLGFLSNKHYVFKSCLSNKHAINNHPLLGWHCTTCGLRPAEQLSSREEAELTDTFTRRVKHAPRMF